MEQVCINENDARFSQSKDAPPMTPPSLLCLGLLADTLSAEEVLQGMWSQPPDADACAVKLLDEMAILAKEKALSPLKTTISNADHTSHWKKNKEITLAPPASSHFSHCEANCEDAHVLETDTSPSSLPHKFSFAPHDWKQMLDVKILKKAGVHDIKNVHDHACACSL